MATNAAQIMLSLTIAKECSNDADILYYLYDAVVSANKAMNNKDESQEASLNLLQKALLQHQYSFPITNDLIEVCFPLAEGTRSIPAGPSNTFDMLEVSLSLSWVRSVFLNERTKSESDHLKEVFPKSIEKTIELTQKARKALENAHTDEEILKAKKEVHFAKQLLKQTQLVVHLIKEKQASWKAEEEYEKKHKKDLKNLMASMEEKNEELQDEYDDLVEAEKKANRVWYDVWEWTAEERKGRVLATIYAVVCGVATFVGLTQQDTIPFLATLGGAIIGTMVTVLVNEYGFWDNVSNIFKKQRRSERPSSKLENTYKFVLVIFAVGALINAAQQVMPLLELIAGDPTFEIDPVTGEPTENEMPMSNQEYWRKLFLPTLVFGGATAIALVGLFTQAPRKWFTQFSKEGFEKTIKDGFRGITIGQETTTGKNDNNPYTTAGAAARWMYFSALILIFSYAIWAGAKYAGLGVVNILDDVITHSSGGNIGEDHADIASYALAVFFALTRGTYLATIAQKITIHTSAVAGASASIFKQQYTSILSNVNIPIINHAVALLGTIVLLPLKAEAYCWIEAVKYARIQYNIKGSSFFLLHVIMRALANHMHWGGILNAVGNGAQNGFFYREGLEKANGEPMTQFEKMNSGLAEATGFYASASFYAYAAFGRTKALPNAEKYIEMNPVTKRKDCVQTEEEKKNPTFLPSYKFSTERESQVPHPGKTFSPDLA